MADKSKASEKKATDAKATNAKTTGAKASGVEASGVSATNKAAASKVVDAAADAIKTAAAETPGPGDELPGDGSLDRTPTKTQITTPDAFPNATEKLQEPKLVRHDTPPGVSKAGADPTTIVEEVRFLDDNQISGDDEKDEQTMRVLAHSQGINQAIAKGDGVKVMLQDGEVLEKAVPKIPEAAKAAAKPD